MDRDERQRVRAERYRMLSQKAAQKAEDAYLRSKQMSDVIPMGQPIHRAADRRYRYNGCWQAYINFTSRRFVKSLNGEQSENI